jgi:MoxR-like ATPase
MPWRFVGRTEQLKAVCRGLADSTAGPVIITGMPGMGRTTLIAQALSQTGPSWDRILRVPPRRGLRARGPAAPGR